MASRSLEVAVVLFSNGGSVGGVTTMVSLGFYQKTLRLFSTVARLTKIIICKQEEDTTEGGHSDHNRPAATPDAGDCDNLNE
jgi:hypothetical protein